MDLNKGGLRDYHSCACYLRVRAPSSSENALKLKRYKRESARGAHKFPTIAQLVERPTVVVKSQPSDGPWFESGLSDLFYWPCMPLSLHPLNLKLGLIKSL